MDERLNTPEVRVYLKFLRAHAMMMREIESALKDSEGISLAWYDALTQLALADGQRMTHTKLSQRLLVSGGNITRLVDRMAKAGLVVRRASRKDRRTSHIVLTDKGRGVYERATDAGIPVVQKVFANKMLTDEIPALDAFFRRVLGEEQSETPDRLQAGQASSDPVG